MATPEQIQAIAGLYVAYFNRAPDPAGLQFWVDQLDNGRDFATISQDFADSPEAKEIFPFLATPDISSLNPTNLVTSIFNNMFDRDPDPAGLAFWVDVVESGAVAVGDMVEAIMMGAQDTVVNGQLILDKTTVENKIECALEFTVTASNIPGFTFGTIEYQASRAAIEDVNATQESVDAAKFVTANFFGGEYTNSGNTFTLCPHVVEVSPELVETTLVTKTVLYWGYNPHLHGEEGVDNTAEPNTNNLTNEGPADGGIPADAFFGEGGYLSQMLNAEWGDLFQLLGGSNGDGAQNNVDPDAQWWDADFSNLGEITIGDNGVLTFNFADGTSDDVVIAAEYVDFVTNLIFDSENNTRFFEKEVAADVPVWLDEDGNPTIDPSEGVGEPIGRVDAVLTSTTDAVYATIPPILTPTINNGGTFELGFTSDADDLIVAGHLDLLHTAIIDGGLGFNTLEIDAKGHFAQPKSLINIQQININNLPNVYTTNDENSSQYPDVVESSGGSADSIIDLSRAVNLQNVTITEGDYNNLEASNSRPGDLTVTGLRNNATLTLQGDFQEDVYVTTGPGFSADGFTVILENVSQYGGDDGGDDGGDLYISDNSPTLNLVSKGGGNNIESIFAMNEEYVRELVISGDAHLFIEESLEYFMAEETPVIIDASANTGGVDLNYDEYNQGITFIGSQGNDRFSADAGDDSSTSQGPDYGNDAYLNIINTVGDNYYDVYSSGTLNVTDGDGDIILKADVGGAVVSLGNGNNTVAMEVTELDLTVGDGDNFIDIDTEGYTDSYINKERFPENVKIVAGDGANEICVDVYDNYDGDVVKVDITAGNGGNSIEVKSSDGDEPVDVTINTGSGADSIKAVGSSITINSGGGNDTITLVGIDSDFVFDEVDTENAGSGGSAIDSGNPNRGITSNEFNDGVLLNINTGTGSANIHLGMDGEMDGELGNFANMNVIAKDGSVITGENITLHVNTYANLIAADLSGITNVILDDDAGNRSDSAQANDPYAGDRAQLTLTAEQFAAIGADNFSVDGATFNTHAFVKLIISEDTNLSDLGIDDLPKNIDLYIEINDGAQVTMTAEQLHTRIARDGVTLAEDGNTDMGIGSVVITGGGLDFDPFNTNDRVQSIIAGNTYYGGSLSQDFMVGSSWFNVQVKSVFGGYDRPQDVAAEVYFTIDGDVTPEVGAFDTWHSNVEIVGNQDITFTGPIELGLNQGNNSNLFTVDFSALEGNATGLTLGNFEMVEAVYGNGGIGYDAEVFVEIAGNADDNGSLDVGFDSDGGYSMDSDDNDDRALISQGVFKYTVTVIDGQVMSEPGSIATIRLCDQTEDLETIALRGNWNDTLEILDAAHGLDFELQAGGTLKREGPTHTANVGKIDASFKWDHASTTVDIIHSVAGDTRPIDAAGIVIDNADTITVNSEGPAVTIGMLMGNSLNNVVLNAAGDMTIEGDLDGISTLDASGVDGLLTAEVDAENLDGAFTFTGGAGGAVLTIDEFGDDAHVFDGGAGGLTIVVDWSPTGTNDLTNSTLTNVTGIVMESGANLILTMDQVAAIGAENFSVPEATANLSIKGLSDQEFSLANFPDFPANLTISVMLADDPKVELHPNTDLTGISGLMVPEGTTLCLTMAQFQQLNGDGTITGAGNLVITNVTQADVGANGSDLDMDDVDLTGSVTLILGESVDLSEADLYSSWNIEPRVDVFEVGDDMTLILGEVTEADGVIVNGGTNSTLQFTDVDGFLENIDASGFDVDELRITDLLVSGNNVDYIFEGLLERVTKVIYNDDGKVAGRLQNVVIEEGTTIFGDISFNDYQEEVEVSVLTVNMEGGVLIDGDLIVSTVEVNIVDDNLVPMYLMELNINSTGTGANNVNGDTENVISGNITPLAYGFAIAAGSRDNNLKTVNINAEQDLVVEGKIIFNSHGSGDANKPNDGVTANDDDAATATLNVAGSAAVVINDVDTGDDDVDFLVVNNNGTGDLTIGISSLATVDASDVITLNGSATGTDTVVVSGTRDFSGDTINADWDFVQFNNDDNDAGNVVVTVTQQQFIDIGVGGFVANGDGTALNNDAILNLVAFDGAVAFDATGLDGDINVGTITMLPGTQTLNPATNLTGVGQICVPEGGTLNLTAAQYQQLVGSGGLKIKAIDGADANSTIDAGITVNITDLTQADIEGGAFNLGMIETVGGNVTVTLAESVELSNDDVVQTNGGASNVEFILSDGQDLGIPLFSQADGLEITGTGTTDVFFRFADNDGSAVTFLTDLDVSGYDVTQLHALNVFVGGFNVEYLLSELDSDVKLVIYFDPEDLGMLNLTNRMVIIEPGTTVDDNAFGTALAFNDLDTDDEVFTVMITALGGTILDGDIALGTTSNKDAGSIQKYLQSFTYVSEGDGTQVNYIDGSTTANVINGDITPFPGGFDPSLDENNLLDVNLVASNALLINGTIYFNGRVAADDTASLDVSGTAPVTIQQLSVEGPGMAGAVAAITDFSVNNTGTGKLTITGASNSIELNVSVETLTFTGTGDIVLDTTTSMDEGFSGVKGPGLSTMDASGLSGDLTLGVVEDVDNDDFTFTSGTGVTTMTMAYDDLADGATVDDTGWSFDFTSAAVGSQLTLGKGTSDGASTNLTFADDSDLNIDMGANGVLCIAQDADFSMVNLTIVSAQPIVVKDGATLTLTAEQANGLTIVGENGSDSTGEVYIVGLGDTPVDLSGISADVAELVFLVDNDVTLDPASDLGSFGVGLVANDDADLNPSDGQTLRLSTEAQADGLEVDVIKSFAVNVDGVMEVTQWTAADDTVGNDFFNSTNIAWLFNSISGPLDTSNYDDFLGRLWYSADLLNSVGGAVEQLFNTLPFTIQRVDFNTVIDLDILLSSTAVNRVVELTSFTDIVGLTEIDDGASPEEHIATLRVEFGGEVTAGDFLIGDIVAAPDTDPTTAAFTTLTLNSRAALDDDHFLATEDYVNDNDTTPETGESVPPMLLNTIGNIGVGGTNPNIELMDVVINTFGNAAASTFAGDGGQTNGNQTVGVNDGADFAFQTLTFNSDGTTVTAMLAVTGDGTVTGKAYDVSDSDITGVTIDTTGFTGTLVWTGGSPAAIGGDDAGSGNTETMTFTGSGTVLHGKLLGDDPSTPSVVETYYQNGNGVNPYAGVDASTVSTIDTTMQSGLVDLGIIADIDSEDFRVDNAGSTGNVLLCLGEALVVGGGLDSPELSGTGVWSFINSGGYTVDVDGNPTAATGGPAAGSMTVEVKDATFAAGGKLNLFYANLDITGDVDVSALAPADLNIWIDPGTGKGAIRVLEGGELTISVAQMSALAGAGIPITGSGTIKVVGDATDVPGSDFSFLNTVNVDLSGVTIDLAPGPNQDADLRLDVNLGGGYDDTVDTPAEFGAGPNSGQNVLGSPFNDDVTFADLFGPGLDDTFTGGGNSGSIEVTTLTPEDNVDLDPTPSDVSDDIVGDTVFAYGGNNTYIVDSGFVTTTALDGRGLTQNDVVQIAAGAEFYGSLADGPGTPVGENSFIATADTTNDGVGVIEVDASSGNNGVIDMSLAGGSMGWTIIGGQDDGTGSADTLIGSVLDDFIVDGDAVNGDNSGEEDLFTGSGGADTYVFNFGDSDPLEMMEAAPMPAAEDYDSLEITSVTDGGDLGDGYTVQYRNGQDIASLTISGVATASTGSIATAVAAALNGLADVDAVVDGVNPNLINITSLNGAGFDFLGTIETGLTVGESFDSTPAFDLDVAEVQVVTIENGTASAGEIYTLEVQLGGGTNVIGTFTAAGGESQTVIRDALIGNFNANSALAVPASPVTAAPTSTNQITLTDQNADDGGFTIVTNAGTAVIVASSASSVLDGTETTLDQVDSDQITDFIVSGADQDFVDFGLVAGNASNFEDEAFEDSYEAAANAAEAAFLLDPDLVYVFTGYNDDGVGNGDGIFGDVGLLFVDANGDSEPDTVLTLIGVSEGTFDSDSILGS